MLPVCVWIIMFNKKNIILTSLLWFILLVISIIVYKEHYSLLYTWFINGVVERAIIGFSIDAFLCFILTLMLLSSMLFLMIFIVLLLIDVFVKNTMGTFIDQNVVQLIFTEYSNADNFIDSYSILSYILSFFVIFLLSVLLKKYMSKFLSFNFKLVLLFFTLGCFISYSIMVKTNNSFTSPIQPFSTISNVIYYFFNKINHVERSDNLEYILINNSSSNHIILIVDESIAYSHLSVNGYHKNTTPYLKSIKGEFVNLGKTLFDYPRLSA